jgi:cyd operon protein YbgT
MWYFAWILGVGFAVLLSILNAMWGENEENRRQPETDPARGPDTHERDAHGHDA